MARNPDASGWELASKALENIREGVIVTDREASIVWVNSSFTRMTGYEQKDVIGRKPNVLQSGMHDKTFYRTMWSQLTDNGFWEGEIWNSKKNGEIFLEWIKISAIVDDRKRPTNYVAVFSDITDRKMTERKLEWLANYDMLTGLPNRRLFRARLSHLMMRPEEERAGKHLLFIDLDGFKWKNDRYGHSMGDQLLRSAAERLKQRIGELGTVYRYGGDEFTVLLEQPMEERELLEWADALLESFREPLEAKGSDMLISLSIGIKPLRNTPPETDADSLIKLADYAMYQAKAGGGDRWFVYENDALEPMQERARLEGELREALEQAQFVLHYQPKFKLPDRQLGGFEALIRWNHPKRGLLPPGQFIPLAEETGLIVPIGEWVIERVAAQLAEWSALGYELVPVSVNISALHLQRSSLTDRIRGVLARRGVPAKLLQLEVTESAVMQEIDSVVAVLLELRELGIGLAIDDFGTGYSSLGRLASLPVDTLKIDKSFIQLLDKNARSPIVTAIVKLAHEMNLSVVAEGVENETQLGFLNNLRCELVQGFLFSRPLEAAAIEGHYWKRKGRSE
ncbi:bifunctional diguanylate cyclase/phosphodiesterase [Cohnella sp. AR92]|uniref:putative bifunctional diguanylate cyclase/phosphodiesterase n=1 Tax=Cohnella sp. AR92 TaxID=648716 RepID=UPI00131544E4|nr:EAL domain-containing protein [Cohnella sp. AR92]